MNIAIVPNNSIVIKDASGQPVTTSLAISKGTFVQHKNVMDLVKTHLATLEQFGLVAFETQARSVGQHGGGDAEYAILNEPQSALVIAFMRNSEIVVAFKVELVRGFFEMRNALNSAMPDFSNPAAAARAWADALDAKNEALAIASRATTTKAEIGNRREATAMNTASQAVKKVAALEIELDRSKQYASVKRMEMLYHGQKFEWRKLKSGGQEMGIETIEIFDANYGTVKAYHADVWREVYALSIETVTCEGATA